MTLREKPLKTPHVDNPPRPRGAWDFADRERCVAAVERIIGIAGAAGERCRNGKRSPAEWIGTAFDDCVRDGEIALQGLEHWLNEVTGERAARPPLDNRGVVVTVSLLVALVALAWAINRPDTVVDLATPCWAYNAVVVEHDLEPLECDAAGQFVLARDIAATVRELQALQGETP